MPGAFPFPTRPNPNDEDGVVFPPIEEQFVEMPFPYEEERVSEGEEGQETLVAPESLLPPEAQGETNGGPLGCCLGVTVGIMLSLLLGLIGFGHLIMVPMSGFIHTDAITTIRIATGFFSLLGAIVGGYFGWKVGKRVYREYDSPVLKDRRHRTKAVPKEARL